MVIRPHNTGRSYIILDSTKIRVISKLVDIKYQIFYTKNS